MTGQRKTFKKHVTLMSYTLDPAVSHVTLVNGYRF